tara:strand:- start:3269 stop:3430 length:162 start_codon:yes stop_codon:yes gene_type:complete
MNKINDINVAINTLAAFLSLAEERGVFSQAEINKIEDCVELFIPELEPMEQVD